MIEDSYCGGFCEGALEFGIPCRGLIRHRWAERSQPTLSHLREFSVGEVPRDRRDWRRRDDERREKRRGIGA